MIFHPDPSTRRPQQSSLVPSYFQKRPHRGFGSLSMHRYLACHFSYSVMVNPSCWYRPRFNLLTSLRASSKAIITLQSTSKADLVEKERGFNRHQLVILALALPTFVAGFSAIWYHRQSDNGNHPKTWHGVSSAFFAPQLSVYRSNSALICALYIMSFNDAHVTGFNWSHDTTHKTYSPGPSSWAW